MARSASFKAWVAFWFASLFWGTSFLWIKLGLEGWNPVSLVAFRLAIASALFAVGLLLTRPRIRVPRKKWWVIPVVALLNPYLPFVLISWAETRIDSGTASILNATVPLFAMVVSPFILPEEKLTRRIVAGVFVGFLGIAVLFSDRFQPDADLQGQLAVLLACVLYAFSTLILKRNAIQLPPLALAGLLNGFACLFVWIHALATGSLVPPEASLQWVSVLWLGALGSFAAYTLVMYVIEVEGALVATLTNFAYPLLGLLLGVFLLGEKFQWRLLVGGILVLAGIYARMGGMGRNLPLRPSRG